MKICVLTSPRADVRGGRALGRALERLSATVEAVEDALRWERARALVADGCDYVVFVDADIAPLPDAFGALARTLGARPALVGGRAVVGATQRFGAMLGATRSGPNPFELVPILGLLNESALPELVRGPVDVPQRGMLIASASLVQAVADAAIDPLLVHLELAIRARAAGLPVLCEPSLSFHAEEEGVAVARKMLDLRRYRDWSTWAPETMHRESPRLRSLVIGREIRIMGNFRGYLKRTYPPIDVLVAAELPQRKRLRSATTTLAAGGSAAFCDPQDGDAVRRALGLTGDRYLLLAAGDALPSRAQVEALAERLESSGRYALAVDAAAPPYRCALVHLGRLLSGSALQGATMDAILADAVMRLPARRLYAVGPHGALVPDVLPPTRGIANYDVVFIAAAEPIATNQTLQSLVQSSQAVESIVVYPAGVTTTRKALEAFQGLRLEPDTVDPVLGLGLNRALAACRSEAIAIVRDDAQLPLGSLSRLCAAFARIPRLGVAVPRVGGAEHPEGLPELAYRNVQEMQAFADRRAVAFAREAVLVDYATVPVLVVSREALETVGGFDEAYGFSRCGIEDFTLRVRSANFQIARCDDAYAHLFGSTAASLMAPVDASPALRERLVRRWGGSTPSFDAERDRVPLRAESAALEPVALSRIKVLVPLADQAEWQRIAPLLYAFAQAFTSVDPVDVLIGLDGEHPIASTVSALREILAAAPVPLDATLNVRVEKVADIALWRDGAGDAVRLVGIERDELRELEIVEGVEDVRARFSVAAG